MVALFMSSDTSIGTKVTFFYQHFWPDSPPYASMLRSIGKVLGEEATVSIITGKPSYKAIDRENICTNSEMIDGIQVRRLNPLLGSGHINILRLLQKALFPFRAFIYLVYSKWVNKEKPDIIVAATIPPVINGLFALLTARIIGSKFIYHLQDIYPEIGAVGGIWSEKSFRYRILKWLDIKICRKAECCVVLSEDMQNSLIGRGVCASRIVIINNFLLEAHDEEVQPSVLKNSSNNNQVKVVFAGNLGRFQRLDVVLKGFLHWCADCKKVGNPVDMDLHFLGEGVVKDQLVDLAAEHDHVYFHGHVAFSEASIFIENCHAGIVSIEDNVYKYAYPSKTLTYSGLGTPIFALIENESNLAKEVLTNELGVVCENRDVGGVSDAFARLFDGVRSGNFTRSKTLAYYEKKQSRDVVFDKWKNLIKDVAK